MRAAALAHTASSSNVHALGPLPIRRGAPWPVTARCLSWGVTSLQRDFVRKLCGPCERFSHREHLGHVVLAWTSEYFKNSKEYPDQKIEFSKLKHESNLFFYLLGGGWDVHKIVTSIVTCPPPPPPPSYSYVYTSLCSDP